MNKDNNRPYQICTRCIMDTVDDPNIVFDQSGHCNYCNSYYEMAKANEQQKHNLKSKLDELIQNIKNSNVNGPYNCILALSGGVDSSYMAYKVKELGLRPLAVHDDNNWNSEKSVHNIELLVNKLGMDLFTHVNDWDEFKDIQLAFFKANVIDLEIVTEQAWIATLFKVAKKYGIKYILTGHNRSTEFILPKHWYHYKIDILNIKSIHRKHGTMRMKKYPVMGFFTRWYSEKFKTIETVSFLDYIDYNKDQAKEILKEKIGWQDHGWKHFESVFTRFYQAYILPKKFGVDKRKAHLSTLICSGQISREAALEEMKKPPYDEKQMLEDKQYVMKKLDFTEEAFDKYIREPQRSHLDYNSYLKLHFKILKFLGKDLGY